MDAGAVRQLLVAAFGRTIEADLVDALRGAGALDCSLVAMADDGAVGHVVLSPVTIDGIVGPWAGLGPLAVAADRQNEGLGSTLVEAALAHARGAGTTLVVVLGDPGYYGRFGFAPASRLGLRLPWDVPEEAFMAVAGDPALVPRGLVRYHAAFDAAV